MNDPLMMFAAFLFWLIAGPAILALAMKVLP